MEPTREQIEAMVAPVVGGGVAVVDADDFRALCTMALRAIDADADAATDPPCICANRAKVESMVHPYCPKHNGGDPGPSVLGACQCGREAVATFFALASTSDHPDRLCVECLLARYVEATDVPAATAEGVKAMRDFLEKEGE